MSNYSKSPFSFDGCHTCSISRKAEQEGRSLSENELICAFKVQDLQSKKKYLKPKKMSLKLQ